MPPVGLVAKFPYLRDKKMSEKEKRKLCMRLYKETEAIKDKFASLVIDLKQSVEKSHQVEDSIIILNSREKEFETLLLGCTNVMEVFSRVTPHWSFYSFDIIRLLTEKLGTSSDKQRLYSYIAKFREYACGRMVCDCPTDAFGVKEKNEEYFAVKTDKSMDSFDLEELDDMEYEMNRILGRKSLRLLSIEDGCVQLIFRSLSDNLINLSKDQQIELRRLGVLKISYGDQSMNMPELEVHDTTSTSEL